jgi:hypothetical protein
VFRNSRGLFNNIRQIKQIHCVNQFIEIDSFSKHIIRKDRNNAGGSLLIYFKDYISVIRKNELENHIDESIWVEKHPKKNNV